jgi:hypothetical protein
MSNAIAKYTERKEIGTTNKFFARVNHNASKELFYRNAVAIFGLVPMFALMTEYNKCENFNEVGIINAALLSFKGDPKCRDITPRNQVTFNQGKIVAVNSTKVIDMALLELGYYEKYDFSKIESDMAGIISFVKEGIGEV